MGKIDVFLIMYSCYTVCLVSLYTVMFSLDFFEECIKEERFEAEKLDIMRDAVRAKAAYNVQTKADAESVSQPTSPTSTNSEYGPAFEHENGTDVMNGKVE